MQRHVFAFAYKFRVWPEREEWSAHLARAQTHVRWILRQGVSPQRRRATDGNDICIKILLNQAAQPSANKSVQAHARRQPLNFFARNAFGRMNEEGGCSSPTPFGASLTALIWIFHNQRGNCQLHAIQLKQISVLCEMNFWLVFMISLFIDGYWFSTATKVLIKRVVKFIAFPNQSGFIRASWEWEKKFNSASTSITALEGR